MRQGATGAAWLGGRAGAGAARRIGVRQGAPPPLFRPLAGPHAVQGALGPKGAMPRRGRRCLQDALAGYATPIAGAVRGAGVGRKTGATWLHGHLKKLLGLAGTMDPDPIDPEYGYHTALKVIAMGY